VTRRGEFELSREVLQVIEMIKFRGKMFLRSGTFSEVFVTDSGSSRAVDPWSGQRMDQKLHCSLVDQRKG
jgi:hypothetical protein